jgi:hypothetical protein
MVVAWLQPCYGSKTLLLNPLATMSEQDLANLAHLLHRSRNLTAEQIRNRSGFLDKNHDPYTPLKTIQAWLTEGTKGTTERA